MKYLGIDFGSKKVGFAQSDDEGRIAFPLMIAPNDKMLLKDTVELVREMKIRRGNMRKYNPNHLPKN